MGRKKQHKEAASKQPLFLLEEAVVLGYNVEHLRTAQGFNKTVFSDMAGISRMTLNKIERGECDVQLSMLRGLADALNVTSVDLLTPPRDPRSIPIISERQALLRAFPNDQHPDTGA